MSKIILDCETSGVSPVVKIFDKITGEVTREHKRLLCISVLNLDTNEMRSFYGEDEKQFLIDFFKYLSKEVSLDEILGFNINFDINFIRIRSFYHNVKISDNFTWNIVTDLRKTISDEEYAVGTLKFWGEVCGVNAVSEDGSKMLELYAKKDWQKIKEHSEEDVKISLAVYNRCKECGLI